MKTLSVREVREALPKLEKLLARHGQILVARRGKPIARLSRFVEEPNWPSLEAWRASMPFQEVPSEVLIRQDRDER